MSREKIEDVSVGQIVLKDVKRGRSLLLREGCVITASVLNSLHRLGIKEIDVCEKDKTTIWSSVTVSNLTEASYIGIKKLNITDLCKCSESLVESMISGEYDATMHLLYDYDKGTYTHSRNVTYLAVMYGIAQGLSIKELKYLALGSLLHDVGKLSVPLKILNKPARLTTIEFDVIRKHPEMGYELVKDYDVVTAPVKQIILQHHENFDGSGYPRCLVGSHSYDLAQIVRVCDMYEALCAKRPYKPGLPRMKVIDIMEDSKWSQLNPGIVDSFLKCVPIYLVGETVIVNGKACIVTAIDDNKLPIIMCGGREVSLREAQTDTRLQSMEAC